MAQTLLEATGSVVKRLAEMSGPVQGVILAHRGDMNSFDILFQDGREGVAHATGPGDVSFGMLPPRSSTGGRRQ